MLPRSLFLIVAASCWLQINAVPVQSQEDYQDLQNEGEDLLDYAFTDNDGAESSDTADAVDETSDKTSILETIKDTMETMDKMGALKDKQNINVNANSPKYKKKSKKSKSGSHKRVRPKPDDNDETRRSTQLFQDNIDGGSRVVTDPERDIAGAKSRNHCSEARRSILNNYSQTINLNSSYLGIDEDFTIKSQAKMKKTHTVFTDDYITLCWIETTTIKEDNSIKPPKRLVLREFTITFENAVAIPDEYLSCPEISGDLASEAPEAVCHTRLGENIGEDTQFSRVVNLTKTFHEDNVDVHVNKVIKCAMGSVITKDVFRWLNPSESTRQRVEIKVSPDTYATNAFCSKYQHEPKLNTEAPKNDSAECSDESKEEEINDDIQLEKGVTECSGDSCSDVESIASTIKSSDVSEIHSPSFTTVNSSTGQLDDFVTQPSVISSITNHPEIKQPLVVSESEITVSQPSAIPEINNSSNTNEPLNVPEPGDIMLPPSVIPEKDDNSQSKKPLYLWRPRTTVTHSPVHTWFGDIHMTTKSPDTSELIDSLSSEEMKSSVATRRPKFLDESQPELHPPHLPIEAPCIGPDCPNNNPEKFPTSDSEIGDGQSHNITSDETSCEGSDCEDIESIHEAEMSLIEDLHQQMANATSSSEELIEKEKEKLYIPKPFICPVNNKIICAHLERIAKLQAIEKTSSEENLEKMVNGLEILTESNETSSSEELGVELGDIVPVSTAIPSIDSTLSHSVSTMPTLQSSSLEHVLPSFVQPKPHLIHGTVSHESESASSSEAVSDEMKTIVSSSEDASWSAPGIHPPAISINQTQQISDLSNSNELLSSSAEMEKNYGSNEKKLNESCDETGNCFDTNTSYTSRISPSSSTINGQVTPVIKDSEPQPSLEPGIEEEDDDDESCDCDEESEEAKKCDPQSGICEPATFHSGEEKLVTPPMLDDGRAPPKQPESMTPVPERQGPTSPTIIEKDEVKGTGTESTASLTKNHKLSLKIHVTLEHIDENKENSQLAQVEKDVLLNELPEQHGNHSLYWHIQALNRSANDVESLRDLFNCTILEKLTEEAIMNQLNITDTDDEAENVNDNVNRKRYRRSVENTTATVENKNNNETMITTSLIKDFILPHIREDIKAGLSDMLDHILAALNTSRSNVSEKSNDVPTSTTRGGEGTTEASESTTVTNRVKRSLMSRSDASDVEELSRWSNERFTPSTDSGQLRSFTELKILRNFVGVK